MGCVYLSAFILGGEGKGKRRHGSAVLFLVSTFWRLGLGVCVRLCVPVAEKGEGIGRRGEVER